VLVHDRLVAEELVAEAPHDAQVISRDGVDQAVLNELLVDLGRAGLDVVRLKGGDPFVFGRGGEEALALNAAGIAVEVVPGVSSLAAVPAAAGIPVTHRGVSDRVTIASCQGADGGEAEYARLAAIGGTLVLFMGLGRVERVVDGLLAAGMAPQTPAAVVSRGTLPDQEVVRAPLASLAAASTGLPGPALLVIGGVAALDVAAALELHRVA
jgi:siroheme synthase